MGRPDVLDVPRPLMGGGVGDPHRRRTCRCPDHPHARSARATRRTRIRAHIRSLSPAHQHVSDPHVYRQECDKSGLGQATGGGSVRRPSAHCSRSAEPSSHTSTCFASTSSLAWLGNCIDEKSLSAEIGLTYWQTRTRLVSQILQDVACVASGWVSVKVPRPGIRNRWRLSQSSACRAWASM